MCSLSIAGSLGHALAVEGSTELRDALRASQLITDTVTDSFPEHCPRTEAVVVGSLPELSIQLNLFPEKGIVILDDLVALQKLFVDSGFLGFPVEVTCGDCSSSNTNLTRIDSEGSWRKTIAEIPFTLIASRECVEYVNWLRNLSSFDQIDEVSEIGHPNGKQSEDEPLASRASALAAKQILLSLPVEELQNTAQAVPTWGGLQLEWHEKRYHMEIEISENGQEIEGFWIENRETGREVLIEEPMPLPRLLEQFEEIFTHRLQPPVKSTPPKLYMLSI